MPPKRASAAPASANSGTGRSEPVPAASSKKRKRNKRCTDSSVTLAFGQNNPKRAASKSHARYEKYKSATTLADFYARGGTPADIKHDEAHGYLVVSKSAG